MVPLLKTRRIKRVRPDDRIACEYHAPCMYIRTKPKTKTNYRVLRAVELTKYAMLRAYISTNATASIRPVPASYNSVCNTRLYLYPASAFMPDSTRYAPASYDSIYNTHVFIFCLCIYARPLVLIIVLYVSSSNIIVFAYADRPCGIAKSSPLRNCSAVSILFRWYMPAFIIIVIWRNPLFYYIQPFGPLMLSRILTHLLLLQFAVPCDVTLFFIKVTRDNIGWTWPAGITIARMPRSHR